MTDKQENMFSMFLVLHGYLSQNSAVVSSVPAFQNSYEKPGTPDTGYKRCPESNYKNCAIIFISYEKNIGGMERILFDFLRLCFIQSILTLPAVKLVPLEYGKS